MFGLFKKLNPIHRADHEIDAFALMVIEEGHIFAEKVIGNLPNDYDENQMLALLLKRTAESETYSEYVNKIKTSFEFSWLLLENTSRHFGSHDPSCSADLMKVGDYVHHRMTGKLLDRYTDFYSSFMDGKQSEIYRLLGNMVNERTLMCAKLPMFSSEQDVDTVHRSVARRVCKINKDVPDDIRIDVIELSNVLLRLATSAFQDKLWESFLVIKNKLVG